MFGMLGDFNSVNVENIAFGHINFCEFSLKGGHITVWVGISLTQKAPRVVVFSLSFLNILLTKELEHFLAMDFPQDSEVGIYILVNLHKSINAKNFKSWITQLGSIKKT